VSAWSGVFDRSRRTQAVSGVGMSNVMNDANGDVRLMNV
jgi:hypothetical protein